MWKWGEHWEGECWGSPYRVGPDDGWIEHKLGVEDIQNGELYEHSLGILEGVSLLKLMLACHRWLGSIGLDCRDLVHQDWTVETLLL